MKKEMIGDILNEHDKQIAFLDKRLRKMEKLYKKHKKSLLMLNQLRLQLIFCIVHIVEMKVWHQSLMVIPVSNVNLLLKLPLKKFFRNNCWR